LWCLLASPCRGGLRRARIRCRGITAAVALETLAQVAADGFQPFALAGELEERVAAQN
jgi:hypothetical protein